VVAGVSLVERPWLQGHIRAPAVGVLTQRRRPLIYIYDLPSEFNSQMLQYRLTKVLPAECMPAYIAGQLPGRHLLAFNLAVLHQHVCWMPKVSLSWQTFEESWMQMCRHQHCTASS